MGRYIKELFKKQDEEARTGLISHRIQTVGGPW
jgi:hypothetical protein